MTCDSSGPKTGPRFDCLLWPPTPDRVKNRQRSGTDMSNAAKAPEHQPIVAKPRPDSDRAAILARINKRYENTLRHLGR